MSLFYIISHTLQSILLPPGMNLFLFFLGLFIWWRRYQLIGEGLILLSVLSLWLLSTPQVAYHLLTPLEHYYPVLKADDLDKHASVMVVLGGGGTLAPEYGVTYTVSPDALSRLRYAAYLHRKTQLPIVISGGNPEARTLAEGTEAEWMLKTLKEDFLVPAVIGEKRSTNTADEAIYLTSFFKHHSIQKIYLITNAWHMPRSVFAFRRTGVEIIPAPTGFTQILSNHALLNYLPSRAALEESTIALHEYMGILLEKAV